MEFKVFLKNGKSKNVKGSKIQCKGFDFIIHKEKDIYKATELKSHCKAVEGKTKKECIENLKNKLNQYSKSEIKEMVENGKKQLNAIRYFNNKHIKNLFYKYFGTDLDDCFSGMLKCLGVYSFDIISFDRYLNTPKGVSTKNHVVNEYGKTAARFLEKLIKL